jgi:hypothetical protein
VTEVLFVVVVVVVVAVAVVDVVCRCGDVVSLDVCDVLRG